jgi:hypothetical protein
MRWVKTERQVFEAVWSKQGQIIAKSLMAGFLGGVSRPLMSTPCLSLTPTRVNYTVSICVLNQMLQGLP